MSHIHTMKQIYDKVGEIDTTSCNTELLTEIHELMQKESELESVWGSGVHRYGARFLSTKDYANKKIFNLPKSAISTFLSSKSGPCDAIKGYFNKQLSGTIGIVECQNEARQEYLKLGIAKPLKEVATDLLDTTDKEDAVNQFCSSASSMQLGSTGAYQELCDGAVIEPSLDLAGLWNWAEN